MSTFISVQAKPTEPTLTNNHENSTVEEPGWNKEGRRSTFIFVAFFSVTQWVRTDSQGHFYSYRCPMYYYYLIFIQRQLSGMSGINDLYEWNSTSAEWNHFCEVMAL